jgi:hypothetical protein
VSVFLQLHPATQVAIVVAFAALLITLIRKVF